MHERRGRRRTRRGALEGLRRSMRDQAQALTFASTLPCTVAPLRAPHVRSPLVGHAAGPRQQHLDPSSWQNPAGSWHQPAGSWPHPAGRSQRPAGSCRKLPRSCRPIAGSHDYANANKFKIAAGSLMPASCVRPSARPKTKNTLCAAEQIRSASLSQDNLAPTRLLPKRCGKPWHYASVAKDANGNVRLA